MTAAVDQVITDMEDSVERTLAMVASLQEKISQISL